MMLNIFISFCQTVMQVWQLPALAVLLLSFISFCLYGVDKWKAKHDRWRISEKTLLLSAFFFGAVGAYLGMRIFHHKTQHGYFVIFVPLFMLLQVILAAVVVILGLAL